MHQYLPIESSVGLRLGILKIGSGNNPLRVLMWGIIPHQPWLILTVMT
ncbi:MAG: hypothetical protein H0A76_00035 [Candidatus Thiodubiliella endoseptemdiera]|uniref:Uncharacterized protein n=1 Tax=Candidatus Thiodubiliella endoseptemdiera TaxID=2738886 RepID=A0A853F1C1_9GAMM|nr:hypothetical protein [Candidatus Thiodubiliella endoseptemdiera]